MSELENLPLKEDKIKLGFETETVTLQINEIIPRESQIQANLCLN